MSQTYYYVGNEFFIRTNESVPYISTPGNVTAEVTLDIPSDYTGPVTLGVATFCLNGDPVFGLNFPINNVAGYFSISSLGLTISGTFTAGAGAAGTTGALPAAQPASTPAAATVPSTAQAARDGTVLAYALSRHGRSRCETIHGAGRRCGCRP